MRDSQFEKMSLKDLLALDTKVKAAIEEKRVSERHEMRAKMEELARASGFSVARTVRPQRQERQQSRCQVSQP